MAQLRGPDLSSVILPRCRQLRKVASLAPPVHRVEAAMAGPVVTAHLLNATGLHWVVQLRGGIEAVVEYDARRTGIEVVKVDSRVVCREGTLWGYNGHFAFSLPNHGKRTRAELEIRTSLWSAVTEFRLHLDGITVFVCESDIDTCALPVPACSPALSRAGLPFPHQG